MTQVNLLPTIVREKQKSRAATAAVVAAMLGVLALLGFIYVLQAARLTSAQHKLEAQQVVNRGLQDKIAGLQQFAALKTEVAAGQALVQTLQFQQVQWSGVLRDVSMVIPNQAWLTSLTGTSGLGTAAAGAPKGAAGAAPAAGTGATPVANIQFQGFAFSHVVVAQWLTRLTQVNGWVNSWLTSSSKATGTDQVQWGGTVDLSPAATANGGKS
jgi:Tfp pilus assembly protein PilN